MRTENKERMGALDKEMLPIGETVKNSHSPGERAGKDGPESPPMI